ncbi:transposase, partial [Rhodoplanes sp. SY1]|uniref:IS66 family transposase n=1 Tax=Rhodoplanes sp. SY1 TaxID=3166646 RepID=UPI0038B43849
PRHPDFCGAERPRQLARPFAVAVSDSARRGGRRIIVHHRSPAIAQTVQSGFELALDQRFDERANAAAHRGLDRIIQLSKMQDVGSIAGCDRAAFVVGLVMAWSPIRRANAGRFEVQNPGDYATLNSHQSRDGTVDGRDKLLVFLTRRDIEPTNNVSERALRPSVIFRKVTNGFRSAWRAKVYADICSVVATGRIHGQSPLASLRAALATASVAAPA